jgi:hypothetical protein
VRHQRDLVDLRQGIQARPRGAEGVGAEAEPVHAAVQLQEHPLRGLGLVRCEPVDLLLAVHGVPQAQARAQLEVACFEAAFEQQHRTAPAEGADALGFIEVEQRKAVGAAQAVEGTFDAVAVGVGLDDGPHPCVGRVFAGQPQVVREGAGVDQRFDRAGHGNSFTRCDSASVTRHAFAMRKQGGRVL